MRDWKFLLTSQLVKGQWLLSPDYALAAGMRIGQLLEKGQGINNENYSILSDTKPLASIFADQDGNDSVNNYDSMPEGSIAVFYISGTLLKYGTWCSYGTEEIATEMRRAANHKNVAGALLVLDSGGGAVNAVAPIEDAISLFQQLGKPVLAHADSAYSAAYWLASKCNHIMASNEISSGFGSIGVMMSFMDVRPYYEEMGIKFHTIYAPESEEKNLPFEEALKGKYELIKTESLSPLARAFQEAVKTNRGSKLKLDDEKILKGKTYGAKESVANGLADSIGNFDAAIKMLFNLIEVNKFLKSN